VCHGSPPPIYAMKDVFGRFGDLIDIYMLNGKNFGYAKYASKDSADKAILVSYLLIVTSLQSVARMKAWQIFCNSSLSNNVKCFLKIKDFLVRNICPVSNVVNSK